MYKEDEGGCIPFDTLIFRRLHSGQVEKLPTLLGSHDLVQKLFTFDH